MIIRIKKGYHVQVDMTRKEMNKRGFRFRTFSHDPQKFSVMLTEEGSKMYKNEVEALMAMRFAFDKYPRKKKGGKDESGKQD